MNPIERAIALFAPGAALARARNRAALQVLTTARYDAATTGNRGASWRRASSDADAAASQRARLSYVARDMVRNTAFAARAQAVIAANVVGDGIIPKVVVAKSEAKKAALMAALKDHFDTTAIDANGRQNLYGLQRLVMNTVVDAGEVLIRRRRRARNDGLGLPFQIEVLEPDFLCTEKDGTDAATGNTIRDGIEYDSVGRRVAYWLFREHPGAMSRIRMKTDVRRVPASEIIHVYRQDRPGQMRGVTWFAPIAMLLQDMADYADAQLMRQKIAACFAAFRTLTDSDTPAKAEERQSMTLKPGRIETLLPGEDIKFSTPPAAEGFAEFSKYILRASAMGIGITYEALTGDLEGVNFSSGRMGRSEMNRNVSGWQWLLMVPQFLNPLAGWALEAWSIQNGALPRDLHIEWVPPMRELVDPTREITALADKVRAGFTSRQSVVRELGYDPEQIMAEIEADALDANARNLAFDTDARAREAIPAKANKEDTRDDDDAPPAKGSRK